MIIEKQTYFQQMSVYVASGMIKTYYLSASLCESETWLINKKKGKIFPWMTKTRQKLRKISYIYYMNYDVYYIIVHVQYTVFTVIYFEKII